MDPSGLYSFRERQGDFGAGLQVVHEFGYRVPARPGRGRRRGDYPSHAQPARRVRGGGGDHGRELSSAGNEDLAQVAADAGAGGLGGVGLGELAAQGSSALQFQFQAEEPEGAGCPNGGAALSGSKGGSAGSGAVRFERGTEAQPKQRRPKRRAGS